MQEPKDLPGKLQHRTADNPPPWNAPPGYRVRRLTGRFGVLVDDWTEPGVGRVLGVRWDNGEYETLAAIYVESAE